MYNDLQDALGYRMDQNAPFNPTYSIATCRVAVFPATPPLRYPRTAKLVPGGVQPNLKTPTLISWSLRVQQELSPNTSLTVGYVGSHGYHEMIGPRRQRTVPGDLSRRRPARQLSMPRPRLRRTVSRPERHWRALRTGGHLLHSGGHAASQLESALAGTWTWFRHGDSSYNALQVDVNQRFSHGFSVRGVYTWSKALDDGDSLNGTTANNAPGPGVESLQSAGG